MSDASVRLYRILLPTAVGTAFSLTGDAALYAVLPTHTGIVGVTLVSVGILLSANRWVRLIANNVAGWLCDRRSKRVIFILSLFLGAFSTALYGWTTGFWPLLAGRLLWGIAWAGLWVAGNGLILDASPATVRGKWIGRYHMSFFFGAALGAYMGGFLTDFVGYHQAMKIAAVVSLIGAVQALIFLPRGQRGSLGSDRLPPVDAATESTKPAERRPVPWAELLSATSILGVNRIVIAGILASTLGLFIAATVGDSLEIGGRTIGLATMTGFALGTNTILGIIFTPLMGSLSDKSDSRWHVVTRGLLPGIAGFAMLAFRLPFALLVGLPLTSVTSSSNQSISTALMGDLAASERHGRSLGALYTIGDLGSAIGPLLAFAVLPIWGMSSIYALSSILYVLLLVVALYWSKRAVRRSRLAV